ncbi:hypothetical protein FQZ97_1108120 [compost metagenome]
MAGNVVLEHGALGLFPAGQQGHQIAGEQLGDGLLHVVLPVVLGRVLCGVLDLVAQSAEASGFGVEGRVVELRQACHGAGKVDALHAAFLRAS